jgi:hypothetical protein
MICQQFEQLAPQMARDELRDAKLLQDATNHAASCVACNAILVEAREIAAAVAALAARDKSVDSAGHLEFALRAAFAREAERASRIPNENIGTVPTTQSRMPNVFAGATFRWAALLLAAAIILGVLLLPRMFKDKSVTDRAVVSPAQVSSPVVAGAKIAPAMQTAPPVTEEHLAAVRKPKKNLSEPEKTLTGFLVLPYADDLSTIEYGAIVRLQMSRADLAWYGLPVPISDSGQRITADLFVNGSGTPEAIRLVR